MNGGTMATHDNYEQYLLELINRARLDPEAELERYNKAVVDGIYSGELLNSLNDSLPFDSISANAKQVLAPNSLLQNASKGHSQHMLAVDRFAHSGIGDGGIGERANNAGYNFNALGENIAWYGTTGTFNLESSIDNHHFGLFRSAGHRDNLLDENFTEAGLARESGLYTTASGVTYNASMLTEMFGAINGQFFVTGVVYNDEDNDDFYSIGEGVGGTQISHSVSVTTTDAGGYGLQTSNGVQIITLGNANVEIEVSSANIKLDLVDGDHIKSSGDVRLLSGITEASLLGNGNLNLTGSSFDETLNGNKGNNQIKASDGDDRVYAGKGADIVKLGAGNDYVRVGGGNESFDGGSGKDYISYYSSPEGVTLNLTKDTASGSWASDDTIKDFESASGSRTGNDNITGTSGSNTIKTYGGNDRVYDKKGNDKVELGSGNDYVRVGDGKDNFDGGSGKDYISYYDSTGGVELDLSKNLTSGSWASNDTINNFESASGSKMGDDRLLGTSGSNTLKSYGGDDRLYGRSGDDALYGGNGKDRFDGGRGDDLLYGGSHADIFHFDHGANHDIIKDFENDVDLIQLDNFNFTDGGHPFDFATQIFSNVVFNFGNGDILTVENATISQLYNDLEIV